MRILLFLSLFSLLAPACGTKAVDACAGATGTCINVKVVGGDGLSSVDALDIHLVAGGIDATKRSTPTSPLSLPISVAVLIDPQPSDPLNFQLTVTGYVGGRTVGAGLLPGSIGAGQHQTVTVTLLTQTVDHDMAIPDLSGSDNDLSTPDLASGADLAQPTDDGGCNLLPITSIISDFESSGRIQTVVNGNSFFVTVSPTETGTISPAPGGAIPHTALNPARGASAFGLHATASALTGFGATFAAHFSFDHNPVDLSHYSGFKFYVKGTAGIAMKPGIQTTGTVQDTQCSACASCNQCTTCYAGYVTSTTISSDWTLVSVKWTDLAQQTWGMPQIPFSPATALQLIFILPNGDWDMWIDDISLTP